jgi:transcriptional regulator with XRE-family HTH domain
VKTVTEMAKDLAVRLKELREDKRWSLREAAEKTGVSKSMLSKIERSLTSPTATVLGRLAEGFGISISHLLDGDKRDADVIVVSRADQPVFRVPTTGFERRSLSPVLPKNSNVDFVANMLPPGQSSGTFPPHRSGVEETLTVVSGRLQVHLGEVAHELSAGDAVFYRAHVPHRFDNPSDVEPAVFLIVVNNTQN